MSSIAQNRRKEKASTVASVRSFSRRSKPSLKSDDGSSGVVLIKAKEENPNKKGFTSTSPLHLSFKLRLEI